MQRGHAENPLRSGMRKAAETGGSYLVDLDIYASTPKSVLCKPRLAPKPP
jgi:hypothetical protein